MNLTPLHLRKQILHMAHKGQAVHVPCSFSIVEILSLLYSKHLKFNPKDPHDPSRDYFVLSKGHGVMALYACMREIGWLQQEDLDNYFKDGTLLHGLSEHKVPGCEVTSGSLGHGLPIAVGIALGLKKRGSSQKVFCIVGDGELQEGPMWEALMFAGHHKLSNLTVIVDANRFQAMGETSQILDIDPLVDKFKSFGLEATECNGHDIELMDSKLTSLKTLSAASGKPQALVARTEKGKGISFMEGDNMWHYTRVSDETLAKCLKEWGA